MIVERLQTARRAAIRHATAAERAGFAAHEQALTEIVLTRAAACSPGLDLQPAGGGQNRR